MPERNVKVPYKTQSEQDYDVFVGRVMTIKNQARRIEKLEQYKNKSDKLIKSLQKDNDILKYENKTLKDALRLQMTGGIQHA